MPTTIAVTGASGHIGNVVCRQLLEKGYRVRAMYHADRSSLESLPLEMVQGDILNPDDVAGLLEGCTVVIHSAAIITIDGDPDGWVWRTNTEGTRNVLHAAIERRVKRVIHLSSVHAVTELPHSMPYDELRPYKTKADSVYDFSKATGEQIMLEGMKNASLEVVIVRPSAVMGPYDFKPSKMGAALMDFYHQKIPVLPEGGYDFVDVRDVANAIIVALEQGKSGEAYVLSGKYVNFTQLAEVIEHVTGKKMPRRLISQRWMKILLPFVSLYARVTRTAPSFTKESMDVIKNGHPRMDHTKAKRELGYATRPLEESIRDFYNWVKENGKT